MGCSLSPLAQVSYKAIMKVLARTSAVSGPNWRGLLPCSLTWLLGLRSSLGVGWSHHFRPLMLTWPQGSSQCGSGLPSEGMRKRAQPNFKRGNSLYNFSCIPFVRGKLLVSSYTLGVAGRGEGKETMQGCECQKVISEATNLPRLRCFHSKMRINNSIHNI